MPAKGLSDIRELVGKVFVRSKECCGVWEDGL